MITILIADDHRLVRSACAKVLALEKGITVIGEARDGEEAVQLAREHQPNIVLMDLVMPGIGGLEAMRRIQRSAPDSKLVALTACTGSPFPEQVLKLGAHGYITKGVPTEELLTGIRKVYFGQRYVSSDIAQHLAFNAFERSQENPFGQLSNREMQIMLMVVNCHKVSDISGNLHLSPKTVNSYRYRIFDKLNVSSDVELALLAVRHGMLKPEQGALAG